MGAEVANLGDDIRKTSADFEEMGDQNKKYGAHIVFTHAQTELFLVIFLSCCLFMRGTEENGCFPCSSCLYDQLQSASTSLLLDSATGNAMVVILLDWKVLLMSD